jgi:hypothetical protein
VRLIAGDNALKAVIVVGEYSCSWIVIVASSGGALFKVQGSDAPVKVGKVL